ncbi:MAG: hypothetical protein VKO65_00245 [Cyanobacteriota bacterium]|nr:hypothetical protein [Cyanobacteriota bacterium]
MRSRLSGVLPCFAFSVLAFSLPMQARPYLYVSSFSYGGGAEQCLSAAESALRRNGFDQDFEKLYFQDRAMGGTVSGGLARSAITAKIECNIKLKTTSLAVAGADNDLVFEIYEKLFSAEW